MSAEHRIAEGVGLVRLKVLLLFDRLENLLDFRPEHLGHFEGQRQARIVSPGLDGVDRLPRNPQLPAEIGL